jgi:hypothetical protein
VSYCKGEDNRLEGVHNGVQSLIGSFLPARFGLAKENTEKM